MANIFPVDDLRGTLNRKLVAVEAYLEGTLCKRSPHFPAAFVFNVDLLIPLGVTSHLQYNVLLFQPMSFFRKMKRTGSLVY